MKARQIGLKECGIFSCLPNSEEVLLYNFHNTEGNHIFMESADKQVFVIVEDHERSLSGTELAIKSTYSNVEILKAENKKRALELIRGTSPDLVITDIVLPEAAYQKANSDAGITLIKELLEHHTDLRIVVQSVQPELLIRLKGLYEEHKSSFAIVSKKENTDYFLHIISSVLKIPGFFHTPPEMRTSKEFRKEWITTLELAYEEGLKMPLIAKRMNVSEKTVYNYFEKIRNVLDVQLEEGQDMREQVGIKAREIGIIR